MSATVHFENMKNRAFLTHFRYKLEEATQLNAQLLKKEGELEAFAIDNITKHVDALFTEIDLCVRNETYGKFQFCIDKMSFVSMFLPLPFFLNRKINSL